MSVKVPREEDTKIGGFHSGDMKKAVFCDMKPQFVPHRRHIMSPLQSPVG
jgi:hypothetical protein